MRNARHSGLTSLKDIASEDERYRAETEVSGLRWFGPMAEPRMLHVHHNGIGTSNHTTV